MICTWYIPRIFHMDIFHMDFFTRILKILKMATPLRGYAVLTCTLFFRNTYASINA